MAYALAQAGRSGDAREVLREMTASAKSMYISPAAIALVHAGPGEVGLALDWLDRAYALRDIRLVFVQIDHRWAPLSADPRFVALAGKLRLDPAQPKAKSSV